MGILDDYSQFEPEEETTAQESDPERLRRQRADLERKILIADSDLRKLLREKQDLEMGQRRLKKQEERIRIERDELDKKIEKMQDDQRLFEEEIHGLKKKLKVLI